MPAITPEDRITQSDHELHVGLNIPRHSARQIYLWAQKQAFPEGTVLDPPSDYHITLMFTPGGYEDHKDAWWIDHIDQAQVSIKGFASFPAQEDGYAYVLLLDAPEVKDKADEMQARAEALGLDITHFPGGYKPHLTIGYGPSRATGIRSPDFQFDVGPSSVSPPRIKESGLRDVMEQDTDYGDVWVDEKKHKVYLNIGDAFGDLIDEAREEAHREYPGYEIEILDEGARPANTRVAYNPDEVQALDHLSMSSLAANMHHRYEQTGSLNAQESTDYARRLLGLIGYPTDQITLQAALQAWQQSYPEDRVIMETSQGPEKFAADTGELSQSLSQDNDTGILAGPRVGRISEFGYTSPELQQIIDAFGHQYGLTLMADESPNRVSFGHIEVPPELRGQGVGRRVMNQLKNYADRTGKPLSVEHVVNHPFFQGLGWLQPAGSDEYSYFPETAHSTVPTQVNNPDDHWPEFGQRPPDRQRDVQFSNDWTFKGKKVLANRP